MLSAHLQCLEVAVDDDVVEAGANSAVAQLLALCSKSLAAAKDSLVV